MRLFEILRKKEKTFKWEVVYLNSKMEVKSALMMGTDEQSILDKLDKCFKKADCIRMCKVQ